MIGAMRATLLALGVPEAPTGYHAAVYASTGAEQDDSTLVVLTGLYRVVGGVTLALALAIAGMTAFLLPTAPKEASVLIGLCALLAGIPSGLRAYDIARKYGVRSP